MLLNWHSQIQIIVIFGFVLQMIMAQEEILKKEKELEVARRKLEFIRKAKYKDQPTDDEEEGSAF